MRNQLSHPACRWASYGAVTLIVATFSAACESASPNDEIRHPTSEHLPSKSEVDNLIPREQPGDQAAPPGDPGLLELADALRSARQLWLAGTADGPPGTVFGEIRDAAVDSLGRLYVLDAQSNEVRRFSSEGEFLEKVSRTQLKVGGPGLSLVNLPGASWQPARGHRGGVCPFLCVNGR